MSEIGERFGVEDGLRGRQATWCLAREKRDQARRIYGEFDDNVVAGQKAIAEMYLEEGKIERSHRSLPPPPRNRRRPLRRLTSGPLPGATKNSPTGRKPSPATAKSIASLPTTSPSPNAIAASASRRRRSSSTTNAKLTEKQLPKRPSKSASPTRKPRTKKRPSAPSNSPANATQNLARPAKPTPTSRTNTTSTSPSAEPRKSSAAAHLGMDSETKNEDSVPQPNL